MYFILTKPDCTHCDRAKKLLKDKGEEYLSWEYNVHPVIPKLMKKSGLHTVPQIWHDHIFVGGADDLAKYLA